MNKKLIALAVLATTGAAAMAQSSVTLWGVLDLGLAHTSTSGSNSTNMTNGGLDGANKLGFKGVEDLGGGNGAAFYLESGYSANNGTGSAAGGGLQFQRRSSVSLTGSWGEIRIGRDFNNIFENYVLGDAFGDSGIAAGADGFQYANSGQNASVQYFVNNMVKYQFGYGANDSSWGFGAKGLYGSLQGALAGNASGQPATGQYLGGRVGYAVGPFNGAVAYANSKGTGNVSGRTGIKFTEFNVAAMYDLGVANLIAGGGQNNSDDANTKFTHFSLGAQIPAGPGYIPVNWHSAKQNGVSNTTANMFAVGYVYNLSKRTALYGDVSYLKNGSAVNYVQGDSGFTGTAKLGSSVSAFAVGVRHGF